MITRIFHPIGQGAFYSERIGNKTIVYDCGVWHQDYSSKRARSVVKNAFPDNHQIDVLFISHFDFDHVSLVPLLLEKFAVKAIVIPLLAETEKILISQLLEASDISPMAELASNPGQFSNDRNISVIQVKAGEDPEAEANSERPTIEINPDSNIETREIDSGTIIKIPNSQISNWVFIPFNHEEKQRTKQLEEQFKDRDIDLNRLNETDYFKDNRKEIRDAYASLDGNVNENSLFVYSGPNDSSVSYRPYPFSFFCEFFYFHPRDTYDKPACIYTGDGDLNVVNIHKVYKDFFGFVSTIQIPHHGSKKSYNEQDFTTGDHICPISFGEDNNYGHPAGHVFASLVHNRNYPVPVSEKASSVLVMHWECYQ